MKYDSVAYTGFSCMVQFEEEGKDFGVPLEDMGDTVKVLSDDGYSYTVAKTHVTLDAAQ